MKLPPNPLCFIFTIQTGFCQAKPKKEENPLEKAKKLIFFLHVARS